MPDGWVRVHVRAASLNHHDLWSLKGVGLPADRLPMVLGCDAAGVTDDGREVVVHALVGDPDWTGDETLDPKRSILSERHQGTLAEQVVVPARNLVPKPAGLSFEQAACLPTAWLTAYRMLFTQSGLKPGDRVLVQGAGGGVATAAIVLGRAAGLVGLRDQPRRGQAGPRPRARARTRPSRPARGCPPASTRCSRPSARRPGRTRMRVAAARRHARRLRRHQRRRPVRRPQPAVLPAAARARLDDGHPHRARAAAQLCEATGVAPLVDEVMPLSEAARGFERLQSGDVFGKIVLTP